MMRTLLLALLLTGCGTDGTATTADTGTTSDSGGDSGNSGPVLSGLERFCEAYKTCGGTYYATAQDCVDATLSYWGSCPSRRTALDAFGECMADVPCDSYNPDTYDPGNTDCAAEWEDINDAAAC